ncbi:helix-turn-helix transcriptional regulator [Alkalihalobacillus sp. FSL R5-0424]
MTKLEYIIKQQGRQKGWLAERAHISKPTITGLVKGTSKPSIEVALKISIILGVTVEELWGGLIDDWKAKEGYM